MTSLTDQQKMDKLLAKQRTRIIAKSRNQNLDNATDVSIQPIIESVESAPDDGAIEDVIKVEFSESEAPESDSIPLSELVRTKSVCEPSKDSMAQVAAQPIVHLKQTILPAQQESMKNQW